MNSICNSLETKKIYKIILYHSHKKNDLIKLIFVGPRKKNIIEILNELLKNKKLGSSKSKILNKEINYYIKIFGELIPNKTYFIYDWINDNEPIYHIQENLCYYLNKKFKIKTLPKDMYMWYKSKILKLKKFLKYLNQIFIDKNILPNKIFIERLENILMMNKKEMLEHILLYLPNKYKNIKEINFLDKETFTYNLIINSEELIKLLENSYISLTNKNNIFYNNKVIDFSKYENPLIAIYKKYVLSMKYINNSEYQKFKILSNLSTIDNNNIFCILNSDFKDILDKKLLDYYFPLKNDEIYKEFETEEFIKKSYYIRQKNNYTLPSNNNYKLNSLLEKKECYVKSLLFKINSDLYQDRISDEQLLYLFKNNKTYYSELPIIKICYNKRTKIINKFNKLFIKEKGKEEILNILMKKEDDITKNNELSYICYK